MAMNLNFGMGNKDNESSGSTTKPPKLTNGDDYSMWKKRMEYFYSMIDFDLWNSITSGPYVAYRGDEVEGQPREIKTYAEYDEEDKKRVAKDQRALAILTMALSMTF